MPVFLPVHPEYVTKILAGTKRYEFRRRLFRQQPECVILYATAPVQRIVGWFRVDQLIVGTPEDVWDQCVASGQSVRIAGADAPLGEAITGLARGAYDHYFAGQSSALALGIAEVVQFARPLPVREWQPAFRVPQSFCYVSTAEFERLVALTGGQ